MLKVVAKLRRLGSTDIGESEDVSQSTSNNPAGHSADSCDVEEVDQGVRYLVGNDLVYTLLNIIVAVAMLYLACTDTLQSLEDIFAASLAATGGFGWFFIIIRILTARESWRIEQKSIMVDNWLRMPLPGALVHHPTQPITAISQLAALRGSSASRTMLVVGYVFWILTVLFITLKISLEIEEESDRIDFLLRPDTILVCVASLGYLTVGTWELNPWSLSQRVAHRISAFVSVCGVIAFAWQQSRQEKNNGGAHVDGLIKVEVLVVSCLLVVMVVAWGSLLLAAERYGKQLRQEKELSGKGKDSELNEEDKKKLYRWMIKCLGSQLCVLLLSKWGIVMWVWYTI